MSFLMDIYEYEKKNLGYKFYPKTKDHRCKRHILSNKIANFEINDYFYEIMNNE